MFDFSEDEVFFMLVAAAAAGWGLFRWFRVIVARPTLGDALDGDQRAQLAILPLLCLGFVAAVIWKWSDPVAVAGHIDYVILFIAGAGAWFVLTIFSLSVLGINVRHDVVVNGNRAAAISVAGAALATTLIYTGGNIGAGPTIWTTIFPAALGSLTLLSFWFVIETTAGVSDAITIDRDRATGIRIAGWAIATAIILGRSVAGDWTGWDSTFEDFVTLGWPSAVLTVSVIAIQMRFRPSPEDPHPPERSGMLPALVMILFAILYVISTPPPEIGKHVITYEEYMNSR
jgi:uncharacterized membrane protein YjfL (UPF0719 family)